MNKDEFKNICLEYCPGANFLYWVGDGQYWFRFMKNEESPCIICFDTFRSKLLTIPYIKMNGLKIIAPRSFDYYDEMNASKENLKIALNEIKPYYEKFNLELKKHKLQNKIDKMEKDF